MGCDSICVDERQSGGRVIVVYCVMCYTLPPLLNIIIIRYHYYFYFKILRHLNLNYNTFMYIYTLFCFICAGGTLKITFK